MKWIICTKDIGLKGRIWIPFFFGVFPVLLTRIHINYARRKPLESPRARD